MYSGHIVYRLYTINLSIVSPTEHILILRPTLSALGTGARRASCIIHLGK